MPGEVVAPPRWRVPSVKFGEAATAAFLIAVASGVAIAIVYDPSDPLTSVAVMLLANPAAAFFRNLHYWSAQAFLVLSLLHAWDHMRRPEARRLKRGPWWRVCLSVPAMGLLAWSGFVLKGDVEALQALRVVSATVADVPFVGPLAALTLFGRGEGLQLVYIHHAATFTLFVWLIAVEHGRLLWPRSVVTLTVLIPSVVLSLWLSPALHDGLSAVIKGPWYFVGLQEAFHWSPWPRLVVFAAVIPMVALFAMRWMSPGRRRMTVHALVAVAVAYGGLTLVGWAFRGANWAWTDAWRTSPRALVLASVFGAPDPAGEPLRGRVVPVVMGRPEGCLVCHARVTGLSEAHDPATIGCAACHLGNVFSLDMTAAHAGMLVVPGNLDAAGRTCGGECHPGIVTRVERSLMTTMAGLVDTNHRAWGEPPPAGGVPNDIAKLGSSPADSHLRRLCASCHLGTSKPEPWPVTESSRGGGCTACHVTYSPQAFEALERYRAERAGGRRAVPPAIHPNIELPRDDTPCFGCHSRSGRISLSYNGWHEADPPPKAGTPGTRTLEDGRVVVQVAPDVHATTGMLCIDCHTAREVMGDGIRHARQLDQAHVACEDCHSAGRPSTIAPSQAGEETRRIAGLRRLPTGKRRLLMAASGDTLVNAFLDDDERPRLLRKKDGGRLELRAPRPECRDAVHGRISCIGCHTAWAPRCPTCHTRFAPDLEGYDDLDQRPVPGDWIESGGGSTAVPPTLGVRRLAATLPSPEAIDPFIPGMIATLDSSRAPGGSHDPLVRRWYARAFSHTVSKAGRTCTSCHNDPVALGYGEGHLEFVADGPQRGRWRFTPAHEQSPDGLPRDAWVGFLGSRDRSVSASDGVRPLSSDEQRRVLAVGACLTCHRPESPVMRESLRGFRGVEERMSQRCLRPVW